MRGDPGLEAASALPGEPRSPSWRRRLRSRFASAMVLWRTSLRFRVVSIIVAASLLAMLVIGLAVLGAVRAQVYDRAVSTYVSQYEWSYASAESVFASVSSPTVGQVQQLANTAVTSQFDAARMVRGAALLRTEGQAGASFQILEPSSQIVGDMLALVTPELRAAVAGSDTIHWQAAALPTEGDSGQTLPGIVVGQRISVPGAGAHELYVAYSMEGQENTIRMVMGLITLGFLALLVLLGIITYVVVRLVLRPVREASAKVRQIAAGDYEVRMKVDGEDELATLARSFNRMAGSIEDQIERYERVSSVQQAFVSAVSHELRSPVTTIRMAGQLIYDRRDELPKALRRSAELQHKQLISLDTMLSDLLEISRYDAGAMTLATESADIAGIVEAAIEAQVPLALSNGVAVEFEARGDTTATVEARRIERIVRNLVVNGLEHAEGRPVRIRVRGNDDAVAVEVSDHGVGLTKEQASRVFDRFWRADSSRVRKSGGTGLGLTIAREDAELHGGTLECAGELGVGATFLLTLPREPGSEIRQAPIPLRVAAAVEEWTVADDASGTKPAVPAAPAAPQPHRPDAAPSGDEEGHRQVQTREMIVTVPSSGVAVVSLEEPPMPGDGSGGTARPNVREDNR